MTNAQFAWEILNKAIGSYQGQGINHERQNYQGSFALTSTVPGKLLALTSSATEQNGEVYHNESSWIGHDLAGKLVMYVASNNHPAIIPHEFNRFEEQGQDKKVIFRFGDPSDRQTFREEITVTIHPEKSISHHYAWGMPGGDFEPRSGSKMAAE